MLGKLLTRQFARVVALIGMLICILCIPLFCLFVACLPPKPRAKGAASGHRKRLVVWGRPFLIIVVAAIAAGLLVLPTPSVLAAPDFRIIDVRGEYGHLIVEVQHFNADGSHWFYENYTWQGREQFKRPRVTDDAGRLFLADGGLEGPKREDATGELDYYLPDGEDWLRHSRPHLDQGSILSVIQSIHRSRQAMDSWDRGRYRLTTHPLDADSDDRAGVGSLAQRFAGLRETAYLTGPGDTLLAYGGPLPAIDPYVSSQWGTVSTFYPDGDAESTSVDGKVQESASQPAGASWDTLRDAATGDSGASASATVRTNIFSADDRGTGWEKFNRVFFLFDTSGLPDTEAISGATMEVVVTDKTNSLSVGQSIAMVTTTPASNTDIVAADYDQLGTADQATDLTISSLTADSSTFNAFTLNSTGEGNISKTSISKFGVRIANEASNNEPSHSGSTNVGAQVIMASAEEVLSGDKRPKLVVTHPPPSSAAITGTIGDGATEQEVRDGDGTIIITLTGQTWVAAGGTFDAQRQAIINGLDAAESETNGWNAQVRDQIGVSSVVRTSGTVVTITLTAAEVANYRVAANETITTTVPAAAVVGSAITATPTSAITAANESAAISGTLGGSGGVPSEIVAGSETVIITLTNTVWVASGATFNAQRQAILDSLVSNQSDQNGWDSLAFAVGDVVRTSSTIVTVTLTAEAAYAIPATETITVTAPAAAIVYGVALAPSPSTFSIVPSFQASGNRVTAAIDLSGVTDVAYCSLAWESNVPTNTTLTVDTSINGGGSYTTGHANGNCPSGISLGASLASITDFRIRVNLATTDSSVQPTMETLALIIEDDSSQDLYYQLNTTPGTTLTDRSGNRHTGTMSFPTTLSSVTASVGPLTSTRSDPSVANVLSVPEVASAVTGAAASANLFSTSEKGTQLPGFGLLNALAGDSNLPIRALWLVIGSILILGVAVIIYQITQTLMFATMALGLGLTGLVVMGAGLVPGWTILLAVPIMIVFLWLRPKVPV